ncbi:MAG: hypothetical protein AAB276_01125 [Pseudomonadota bacterium]
MRRLWMFSLLFFYVPAALAGQTLDERPTTPDYSKLYYLGYNNATSSSPCIGNPVTPECAVETHDACVEWWDQKLCDMMNYTLPEPKGDYDNTKVREIYKFVAKHLLTKDDIPENYRATWQEGDTVIFMAWQVCARYEHCYTALKDRTDPKGVCPPLNCETLGEVFGQDGKHAPNLYIVRQKENGMWLVIERISSWEFKWLKKLPEKLFQEGLAQMPW